MAFEIRELKITGYINKEKHNNSGNASLTPEFIHNLKRQIQADCVEEILEILERKNRR